MRVCVVAFVQRRQRTGKAAVDVIGIEPHTGHPKSVLAPARKLGTIRGDAFEQRRQIIRPSDRPAALVALHKTGEGQEVVADHGNPGAQRVDHPERLAVATLGIVVAQLQRQVGPAQQCEILPVPGQPGPLTGIDQAPRAFVLAQCGQPGFRIAPGPVASAVKQPQWVVSIAGRHVRRPAVDPIADPAGNRHDAHRNFVAAIVPRQQHQGQHQIALRCVAHPDLVATGKHPDKSGGPGGQLVAILELTFQQAWGNMIEHQPLAHAGRKPLGELPVAQDDRCAFVPDQPVHQ